MDLVAQDMYISHGIITYDIYFMRHIEIVEALHSVAPTIFMILHLFCIKLLEERNDAM